MDLSAAEIRVLGCLLEKQRTTPDQYPLTLNSLRLACNQATNRDPVVQYDEAVIREALHGLGRRGYIRFASGHSSRAAKYRHLLAEELPMSDAESAVMCVLMLRAAQTPGELKQRTDRMHPFESLAEVNEVLDGLIARELVERLERRPGQKEERYVHLLDRDAEPGSTASPSAVAVAPSDAGGASGAHQQDLVERVARLEREVADLRAALERLGLRQGGGEEQSAHESLESAEPSEEDSLPEPMSDLDAVEPQWGEEIARSSP